MPELRQSTASQEFIVGPFLDDTDGKTAETGLTIANTDIRLFKHGASVFANKNSGGGTHLEDGYYLITLDATDSNTLGLLTIQITMSGALPVKDNLMILNSNSWDSKYSTDKLEVDIVQIGGDAQSATDLKDFVDAGYDPATNKVQGVVLVDLTTENTDMVGTNGANTTVPDIAGTAATLHGTTDGKIDVVDGIVDNILIDTNEIQGKLPTNNIMGSSVKTDKDDEIDAIKAKTDNLTFTTANKLDSRVDYVGSNSVTTPDNFKADVSALALAVVCTEARLAELDAANLPSNIDDILVDTGTIIPAQLNNMSGSGFLTSTDSLEAIRNRGDVAWLTGAGGSSPTVEEIRTEMDDNSTKLAAILTDTTTDIPALIAALNNLSSANVQTACDTAITNNASIVLILEDTGTTIPTLIAALENLSLVQIIAGITDGSLDLQQMLRIILASVGGKTNGGGTGTINFRDSADGKNRIISVVDANGNRTSQTYDGS